MELVGILVFFVLGAFAGAFDNLVVYRYSRGNTLFFPKKSRCEICKHDLSLADMIPIAGYLIHGGKCHYCDQKISKRHPILETVTAVLFVLLFLQYGWSLKTFAGCVMICALMINLLSDMQYGKVYSFVTFTALAVGLLCSGFIGVGLASSLFGIGIFAFLYAIIYFFSKGTMGGGDVQIAAIIGAFAGIPGVFLTFVLSSFMAAVGAVILMLFFRNRDRSRLKFSPFLVVSGFIAYTYTVELMNLYASIFPAS